MEFFIVRKIAFSSRKSFSAFIIRIAIAAVALSLSTMIVATSMVNGFQYEIRHKVLSFWSHLQIVPYSLTSSLKESGVYRYQDFYTNKNIMPEARHIQVMALKGGLLKTGDDFEEILLKGVGDDFDWSNFKTYLKDGDTLQIDTATPSTGIIISKITADRLLLKTGDKVTVFFLGKNARSRPFKVKGIYETGLEEFDKKFGIVDIGVIQDLNKWGRDTVGGFEVFLKDENLFKSRGQAYFLALFGGMLSDEQLMEMRADPLQEIGARMLDRLNSSELDIKSIKSQYPGIFDWLELQTMNEVIILALMLVVAAINMITALLILILERTNMIGIMKALGANNVSIRRMFIYYSAVIIGVGLLAGNGIGIGLCLAQNHFHFIKLPQESYYLSYAPVAINWGWIAVLNAGTIITTLILMLLPTMLISRISPIKAIRFE